MPCAAMCAPARHGDITDKGMNTEMCNYPGDPGTLRKQLAECLTQAGLEPSGQYVSVLEYLCYDRTHPSVEDIYEGLRRNHPELSRSRIYTILGLLARAGLIKAIHLQEHVVRYDGNPVVHPHFICKECGAVLDVDLPPLFGKMTMLPPGSVVGHVDVQYVGLCGRCNMMNAG